MASKKKGGAKKKKKGAKKKGASKRRHNPGNGKIGELTLKVTEGVETADGKGRIWGGQLLGKSGKGPGLPVGTVVAHKRADAVRKLMTIAKRRISLAKGR